MGLALNTLSYKQSAISSGWFNFLKKNGFNIKRGIVTLVYYAVAFHLPNSPMPGCKFGAWLRNWCGRQLFQHCGDHVRIAAGVNFGSGKGIIIGDNSAFNADCWIANDTVLGQDVMMGPRVSIISGSHHFDSIDIPMRVQGAPPRNPVVIGDDVWVGTQSIILPGIRVGSHAIIGAGSVVTKDVPEWAIVAGNPAKLIRSRLESLKKES